MPKDSGEALVSVLVPCFNHAKYLEATVRSVVDSSYSRIELLINDDGSTDDSFSVASRLCRTYADRFVRAHVYSSSNTGVTRALNFLLAKASGEFLAILASDDMLVPGGIAARARVLNENPNLEGVYGTSRLVDSEGNLLSLDASRRLYGASVRLLASRFLKAELVMRWSAVGPGLMIRRSSLALLGLYDVRLAVEDREFYLRMLARGTLGYIATTVSAYRVHGLNTSRSAERKRRVLEEIARTNLEYSGRMRSRGLGLFLSSYQIDIWLLQRRLVFIMYLIKAFRQGIVVVILAVLASELRIEALIGSIFRKNSERI